MTMIVELYRLDITSDLQTLQVSPDGHLLAVGNEIPIEGEYKGHVSIDIWDTTQKKIIQTLRNISDEKKNSIHGVKKLNFSKDCHQLLSGHSSCGGVQLWDLTSIKSSNDSEDV